MCISPFESAAQQRRTAIEHDLFLICLAVLAFASTNVDGLLVLLGFLADPSYRTWQVVAGQYFGIGILVAVSLLLSQISHVIPQAYVGLFGLVPVAIGIAKLRDARPREPDGALETAPLNSAAHFGKIMTIAAVVVSNGGDNVGTYVPLFAGLPAREVAGIVTVFTAMTAAWCGIAHYLVRHRALDTPIRNWERALLPWTLIVLGGVVLFKGGAFVLLLG